MSAQLLATRMLPAREPDEIAPPPRRVGRNEQLEAQLDQLRGTLRIAVIDDAATVRPIHRTHGKSDVVAGALERLGFDRVEVLEDDLQLGEKLRRSGTQLAWLAGDTSQRDNPAGHAAALLEKLGVPYVGHRPPRAVVLDNKEMLKRHLLSLGIPTAPFISYDPENGPFRPKVHGRFIRAFRNHWGKFVVKPASGSAAPYLAVVEGEADLAAAVAVVHEATGNPVLIEAYLPGPEYSIATSGRVTAKARKLDRRSEPFAFAAAEHVSAASDGRHRLLDAASDASQFARLHELAREAFVELNLETLVRWDVRADAAGALFVLDADSTPPLGSSDGGGIISSVDALASHGMDFDDLVLSLLADRIDLLFCRQRGTLIPFGAL